MVISDMQSQHPAAVQTFYLQGTANQKTVLDSGCAKFRYNINKDYLRVQA